MTPLGYVLLPIGLAGLLFSSKWLYRFFVFWTLFSATSFANFGEGDNGSAMQMWMFFGFLWLLRLILERLSTLSFAIDRRILRPCLWLFVFLMVASSSLIMPAYIGGRLMITSPILSESTETPLYLITHNFTQLLYLVFGIAIAVCVAHHNLNEEHRHETERIIMVSAIFICFWGLFQFACNVTGLPYPDYVFNTSGSASGKGFAETLDGELKRVTSAAVEPSVLAQGLVCLLPLTLPALLRRGSIFSITIDRFCAVLFLIVLLISTSSTAYLGMFILMVLFVALLLRAHALSKTKAVVLLALAATAVMGVVAIGLLSIPVISDVVKSALLNKSSSGSGLERLMTIQLAFGYFQKFPILGIGFGSATSHDLIVKLLSNIGIVGTLLFFAAILSILRANWRRVDSLVAPASLSRSAWLLSLAVFVFTSVLIEFPLVFGNFWLILGMAIATSADSDESLSRNLLPEGNLSHSGSA